MFQNYQLIDKNGQQWSLEGLHLTDKVNTLYHNGYEQSFSMNLFVLHTQPLSDQSQSKAFINSELEQFVMNLFFLSSIHYFLLSYLFLSLTFLAPSFFSLNCFSLLTLRSSEISKLNRSCKNHAK